MGLTNDERISLVELRLDKARRFIKEAEQMLSLSLWDLAANRFYYACFHAAQALLVSYGFVSSVLTIAHSSLVLSNLG